MKSFLTTTVVAASLVALMSATQSARADTFAFSYFDVPTNGLQFNGSGILTTAPLSGGSYQVIGITGQRNGSVITGLSSFAFADNLLFPDPLQYVDFGGLSFTTASGLIANWYGFGGGGYGEVNSITSPAGDDGGIQISLTIAPVPEPSFYQMSAILALSGAGVLRLRRRKAVKSPV
jgi:hypothetical protein